MTLTGTSARYELLANAELTSENVSGVAQIGTPSTAVVYDGTPDIAYSLSMFITGGDSLDLNMATGAITGTIAGASQVETATVIAAGGCTSDGTVSIIVTGAYLAGSPITIPVAITTVTHTTATLIATAIRTALSANAVISARYDVGGVTAAFTLTDKLKRSNDATLNIEIPAGLGITAAASSADTTAGVGECKAYRVNGMAWDQTDHEGLPLEAATRLFSVLVRSTDGLAGLDITAGVFTATETSPFVMQRINSTGNHPWLGEVVTFAPNLDCTLAIDIHAGT